MIVLSVALALAGKWDGMESNIVATTTIEAHVDTVRDKFADMDTMNLYPPDCVSELQLGEPRQGYGAPFRVRYHAGPWTRLVEGRVEEVGHRHVDVEHVGRFGFTTRYAVEVPQGAQASDGGPVNVTMTTFIDHPPWPFRKAFYTRVRPGWTACHDSLLAAVKAELE